MSIVLYARKSIENEQSISCETQLEYCRGMIRPQEQEEEIITIVDNGCSGGSMDREGFQRMLRLVREGQVSKVIVYRLDRFSRSFVDFANSMEIFRRHKVKFVSSQEAFDTGSAYGEMVMQILMVFAQFERSSIIDRITQAYAHRSELGFYMGGNCPFGFELIPTVLHDIPTKKLQPIPAEAATVKKIFQLYAEESLSLRGLQQHLMKDSRNERHWTTSKLSVLLKNPIYVRADSDVYDYFEQRAVQIKSPLAHFDGRCGAQLYGKSKHDPNLPDWSDMKLVLLSHEGMVDSSVWLKCQRKLAQNRQISNSFSNHTSWLAGKVICGQCGHSMTTIKGSPTKSGSIRRYFNCTGKSHKKICPGPRVTIYAQELEERMDELIREKLAALKLRDPSSTKADPDSINRLKLKIKAIEQSEQQLLDRLLSENLQDDLLALANEKARRLKEQRLALSEQMERLRQSEPESPAADLSLLWEQAAYERKKAAAAVMIHQILIADDGSLRVLWNI